jgi:N-methylhydantoinase A/oxoprolinase/acetone carboxylase beta subunit
VSVWGAAPALAPSADRRAEHATGEAPVVFVGRALTATVLRGELAPGTRVQGPALCALGESTLLVAPGWSGAVDQHGTLRLSRADDGKGERTDEGAQA